MKWEHPPEHRANWFGRVEGTGGLRCVLTSPNEICLVVSYAWDGGGGVPLKSLPVVGPCSARSRPHRRKRKEKVVRSNDQMAAPKTRLGGYVGGY